MAYHLLVGGSELQVPGPLSVAFMERLTQLLYGVTQALLVDLRGLALEDTPHGVDGYVGLVIYLSPYSSSRSATVGAFF